MPSRSRKNSKTPSKSSIPDQFSPYSERKINEEDAAIALLQEASIKYPSLISKDAFVGRIVEAETKFGSHAARVWLSESAMVASSLVPGSVVSVSLACRGSSPLESLVDVDVSVDMANDVGSYFALALVFPSPKDLKNGVRFSWSLAHTMGNPSPGKITFVSPIHCYSMPGFLNVSTKLHHSSITSDSRLSICDCEDMHLKLIPSTNEIQRNRNCPSETHQDEVENGKSSSPRTPLLHRSKPTSPGVSNMTTSEDLVSNIHYSNESIFNTNDIEAAIGNEKSRELLQTCASLWLRARFLLCGNVVAIPVGGQISVFLVQRASELLTQGPKEEFLNKGKNACSDNAQTIDLRCSDVAFFVDYKTKVHINSSLPSETQIPDRTKFKEAGHVVKVGGLSKEYGRLKEIIKSSSMKGILSSLGLPPIKGVLLHGPPGTGKTSLARSCVIESGINLFSVNGPEIICQFHGESEQALCEIFDSASKASPAVVFIDELDAIAPARKDGGDELSSRMVATLLNLMDGISTTHGILVIAATNRPDSIDPALRRPGRLDQEIEIGVPSRKQRLDILHSLLSEMDHALVGEQVQHLASNTHGFVGADLASLCNEAALSCLRRHVRPKNSQYYSSVTHDGLQSKEPYTNCDDCSDDLMGNSGITSVSRHSPEVSVSPSHSDLTVSSETTKSCHSNPEHQQVSIRPQSFDQAITDEVIFEMGGGGLKVGFDDFENAKRKVRPSAMREVIVEIPKVRWEDVGGQKEVKAQLMEAVEWPQKHFEAIERIGTRPPTGVLMFGPPGCSKTLMARAVASEAGLNFLSVKGPELFSKWVGESEKAVKSVFAKARANAPSIIFFDEIDGLAVIRGKENDGASVSDRVMSQLLVELDGLHQRVDVTVIAATNRPDKIDSALLRPGRFDRLLYVGPPNEADREDIFNIYLRRMPCTSDVRIKELAHLTAGCTGADISLICREAALAAIEESLDASEVSMAHFKIGLGRVQSSEVRSYEELSTKFQRLVRSGTVADDADCKASIVSSSRVGIRTLLKSFLPMLLPASILGMIKSFFI